VILAILAILAVQAWKTRQPLACELLCFLLVLGDLVLPYTIPIQHDVKDGCSGGVITPTSSHFLDTLQMVPHSTMGYIAIATVEGVQPGMDFRKRLAQPALAVLAMLFVPRHISG
jgi:hypothetical protein